MFEMFSRERQDKISDIFLGCDFNSCTTTSLNFPFCEKCDALFAVHTVIGKRQAYCYRLPFTVNDAIISLILTHALDPPALEYMVVVQDVVDTILLLQYIVRDQKLPPIFQRSYMYI